MMRGACVNNPLLEARAVKAPPTTPRAGMNPVNCGMKACLPLLKAGFSVDRPSEDRRPTGGGPSEGRARTGDRPGEDHARTVGTPARGACQGNLDAPR